jgi:hypothetical protein
LPEWTDREECGKLKEMQAAFLRGAAKSELKEARLSQTEAVFKSIGRFSRKQPTYREGERVTCKRLNDIAERFGNP